MRPSLVASVYPAPLIEAQIAYQQAELDRFRVLRSRMIDAGIVSPEASLAEGALLQAILATLCAAQAAPSRSSFTDLRHRMTVCAEALDRVHEALPASVRERRNG